MRDAPGSTRQEGLISESKRSSPRHERTPTSTKSTGVPRPVVSESRTTKSPSERRERAHRTASSRPPIRAGGAPVRVPLKLPIHGSSSHGASAVATHVSFRTSPQPRATAGVARGRCGRQRATSTSPTSATDALKTGCRTLGRSCRGAQKPTSRERNRIVFLRVRTNLAVMRCTSTNRPSKMRSSAGSYHAVGEGELRSAPAAREAPRTAVVAGLVPVPLAPQEEDELPAPAARERQTPRYLHLGNAHENVPHWCDCSVLPSLTRPGTSSQGQAA